jgi:hypothetical protein
MKICIAGKCRLPCPKGHHHERSINILGLSSRWTVPLTENIHSPLQNLMGVKELKEKNKE